MGGYTMPLPFGGTLEEAFTEMPLRVKEYVRAGLTVLGRVPPKNIDILTKIVLDAIQSGERSSDVETVSALGVPKKDVSTLLGTLSLLATVIASAREETAQECITLLIENKVIDTNQVATALPFLNAVVQNRKGFRRALETSRLATSALPSLNDFEAVVDVRFSFEKGQASENVAVIIMHIDTDARGQEIWFQLTRPQLERMVKELGETLRNVEQAEKLIEQKSTT